MRTSLATALLLAFACGGKQAGNEASVVGPAGRSDAQGTMQGQPFTAGDSLSYVGSDHAGDSFLSIWVSSFPNACGLASRNQGMRNAAVLVLNLSTLGEQSHRFAAAQPGEYQIGAAAGGRTAQAAVLRTDDACRASPLPVGAASGKVSITNIGQSGASGTFDVLFDASGDRISGAFEAVACPAAPLSARTAATSCR